MSREFSFACRAGNSWRGFFFALNLAPAMCLATGYDFKVCAESMEVLVNNFKEELFPNLQNRDEVANRNARLDLIARDVEIVNEEAAALARFNANIRNVFSAAMAASAREPETRQVERAREKRKQVHDELAQILNGKTDPIPRGEPLSAERKNELEKEYAPLGDTIARLDKDDQPPGFNPTMYDEDVRGALKMISGRLQEDERAEFKKTLDAFKEALNSRLRGSQLGVRKQEQLRRAEEEAFMALTAHYEHLKERAAPNPKVHARPEQREELIKLFGGWDFPRWDNDKVAQVEIAKSYQSDQAHFRLHFFQALAKNVPTSRSLRNATADEIQKSLEDAMQKRIAAGQVGEVVSYLYSPQPFKPGSELAIKLTQSKELAETYAEDPKIPESVRDEIRQSLKFFNDFNLPVSMGFHHYIELVRDLRQAM